MCEITSAAGSGSCGQNTAANGFKTTYSYDTFNNLPRTNVNQSGQLRTYTYDSLGRMTSEINPESGTTTYVYDSLVSSDCGCSGSYSSSGDLVYKADANGNHVCYYYDALHRLTDVGNNHQGTNNPCLRFRYDNYNGILGSRPAGVSISNPMGRLAEAVTDDCSAWPITQASIVTDEWFSYSPRGETTDVWESTRHSGGYYHSTASYYANGALNVLNPLNNAALPTITYGVDGEGRPNTAGASSGMNPVLSTAYDVASRVTGVTLGSYDSDAFTFDANTGRMTQYKHTVGATPQSVIGNLTWNANGTLAALGITDPFNAANQQTCSYGYDDLARLQGVNCGSAWSQAFGYDAFGNLTKSGSVSFQPTYNAATNRMLTLPGFTPTYDANGNTLTDSLHTYAWDAEGHAVTIDSVGLTYDALGRMVEQQNGSSYTQILYSPTGGKLALMNGQIVTKAFIPLPAGATAVYTSGPTLSYFRHPDWLGSSRFASTPGRTMYYSGAYAPFGETYAEAGTADRSFTGQNQDTIQGSTTGLYDFLFREYAQYGRWISPDPAGLGAVNIGNPQTWNSYAYVWNNPTNATDPLGLFTPGPCGVDGSLCKDPCSLFGSCGTGTLRTGTVYTQWLWDDTHGTGPCRSMETTPWQCTHGPRGSGPVVSPNPPAPVQPPLPKIGPASQIAAHLAAYNQCVSSSPFQFAGWKLSFPKPPTGRAADMGVLPNEGAVPIPGNNELYISTMKNCLRQYPLAALANGYTGLEPGSVF